MPGLVDVPELGRRCEPAQQRARDTVERILDAAAVLLDEVGIDGFNTNLLAEQAGVRVRTVYRYFPNKWAVVVALAERYATWEREIVEAALVSELERSDWRAALGRVIDRYVAAVEAAPGFLAVRRAARAAPELRAVDDRAADGLAAELSVLLAAAGVALPASRRTTIARAMIEAAISVLDLAYVAPVRRRRELIGELKRMQVAYLATYLEDGS